MKVRKESASAADRSPAAMEAALVTTHPSVSLCKFPPLLKSEWTITPPIPSPECFKLKHQPKICISTPASNTRARPLSAPNSPAPAGQIKQMSTVSRTLENATAGRHPSADKVASPLLHNQICTNGAE
ncbi:hypothetical protein fugu_008022 [Takifugu bimaculatus]|uniref:Uncharacterized protein n=1 Tax=Takifugu bimaculatus TaxID=433685 RepID=A0A4Z2B0C2_9TELE|nr:hypothetical protein fugu_008022 [Takifugu bimaculatus]